MTTWKKVPLGELCRVISGGTPSRSELGYYGGGIPWVKIGDMLQGQIIDTEETITEAGLKHSPAKMLPAGTVLISIFATIGRTATLGVDATTNQAIAGLVPYDSNILVSDYLRRFLDYAVRTLQKEARGVAQVNINSKILKEIEIPLPPVAMQEEILAILDQADALLAKRRRSIALLDELVMSVFHGMFGNEGATGSARSLESITSCLAEDARNGISPSKGGVVENLVLTLSAITSGSFDGTSAKWGTFKTRPPASKRVDRRDFLVCRGNGNLSLVGLGSFPDDDMPEVVFPDTMIALRVDPAVIGREYLEYVWSTKPVRAQIEAGARTTNGTFKINQGVVESILLALPRIEDQEAFGERIRTIKALQGQQSRELKELGELFASLQARAFRGEL